MLDREFSYLELLFRLEEEGIHFVIRLDKRSHSPKFFDQDGQQVGLNIARGETVFYPRVWYMGKVRVNLAGIWKQGFSEPVWVMTDLEAQAGLQIYLARMKIEESFRDLKSLLGMTRLMNKQQEYMEKMLALLLLVYAVGLMLGEGIRDHLYGELISENEPLPENDRIPGSPNKKKGRKWQRYSGLFILLKQKWVLSKAECLSIVNDVFAAFSALVHLPVRTQV